MGVPAESTKPASPRTARDAYMRGTRPSARHLRKTRASPAMEYRRPVSRRGRGCPVVVAPAFSRWDVAPVGTTPCGCPLSTIRAVPHRGRPAIPEPPLRKNKTAAPAFSRRGVAPVGEAPRGASHTYMRPARRNGDRETAKDNHGGLSLRNRRHPHKTGAMRPVCGMGGDAIGTPAGAGVLISRGGRGKRVDAGGRFVR